jgi:outer membrane protein
MNSFYNNLLNTKDKSSFLKQYSNNFVQEIGVSANIPIFNKGITKLQIEQSEINENLAKNNLDQQRQNVEQKIQKILFDMKSNFEIYSTAKENEKSAYLALDFAEKSFKAGLTSIYDVNVARNNYINAQSSLLQSKYSFIFSKKLLEFYENER